MQLDHIVIHVSDLEKSLPFYEAVLGQLGYARQGSTGFGREGGPAFDLRQAPRPEHAYDRYGVGVNHIGFAAPSRAAVDEVAAQVRAAGIETPATQSFETAYALFLKDPDGMRIEVTYEAPEGFDVED